MLKDYNSQHITNEIRINYFHIVNLKKENVDVYRRYESSPLTDTVIRVRLYDDFGQDIMRAVSSITINDEETLISGSSETVYPSGTSYVIHLAMKPGYIAINDVSGTTEGESLLDYKFLVALLSKAVLTLLNGSKHRILLVSDVDTSLHLSEVSAFSATVMDAEVLEGMTGLDAEVFSGTPELKTVTLPSTMTTIGRQAFSNCSKLLYIELPDAVSTMGDSAFTECTDMRTATIGSGLIVLPEYTFYGCESLTGVSIADGMEEIESGAFLSCSALTSVEIPDTLETIGDVAFSGDAQLTGISFPASFETVGVEAFKDCTSLSAANFDGAVTIKEHAFANCSGITEASFPAGLNTIKEEAFINCTQLSSLTFSGVTTLEDKAFFNCKQITGVSFPASLRTIGDYVFSACSAMSSITFDDGVASIGDEAFRETPVSSLTLPDTLTTIGTETFRQCASLSSLTLSSALTAMGDSAFAGCVALESVTIPNTLTALNDTVFSGCTSLSSVTLGTGLVTIGQKAFFNDSALESVSIPNSVTGMGVSAFTNCTSLSSLTLGTGLTSIAERDFYNCSSLESITIPNSVTGVSTAAFSGCTSVSSLTLGTGLQKISANSFSNCAGVSALTIPAGVNGIGNGAFSGCSGLDHIDVSAVTPATIGTNVFDSTNNCTIYVPWESLDTYKAAANWATYKTRISAYTHTISATANIEFDSNIKFTYKTTAYTYTSGYSSAHTYTLPAGVDYTVSAQTVLGYFDPSPKTVTGHSSADTAVSYSYTETRLSLLRSNGTVINIAKTSSNTAITSAMTSSLTTNAVTDVVKAKVGSGTKLIGDKAFSNEKNRYGNLIEVDLPDGITNINWNAFWACKNLKNWYIGTGMTSVIYGAFARTINASRIYTRGGNPPAFDDGNNGYYVFCDDWSQPYGDNTYAGQIRWTGALIAPSSWSTWTTASPTQSTPLGYWNWHLAPSVIITQDYRSTGAGHPVWSACTEWTIPASSGSVTQAFMRSAHYGYSDPKTALEVEIFAKGTYASTPVTSIGSSAFTQCTNLRSITVHGSTPPTLSSNALQGSFPIYVDKQYVNTYKTAWSAYASRIQPIIPLEKKYIK